MSEPTPIMLSSPDAGNRSAGDILRQAREAQNMTLEGLASTIKVTPAKLEALEQGRHDSLPDANFTRALAMTVCRALKLDPTEVLASLPAAKPAALAEGKPPLNQPFKEVRGGSPLFDRHLNWAALLSFKWLAPMALLAGAVLIYVLPDSIEVPAWVTRVLQAAPKATEVASVERAASVADLSLPPPVMEAPSAPAPAALSASGVVPLVLDSADAASVPAASAPWQDPRLLPRAASAALPGGLPAVAPASAPVAATSGGAVLLSVREAAWVEVRDARGEKLLSRNVMAGETLPLDGVAPFTLRIGNAAGVQLSYKGQAVDLVPMTRNNVARLELK